jgi:hypothetical protein
VSLNKEHQVRERHAATQTVLREGLFDLIYQQEECMLVLYLELERRVLKFFPDLTPPVLPNERPCHDKTWHGQERNQEAQAQIAAPSCGLVLRGDDLND